MPEQGCLPFQGLGDVLGKGRAVVRRLMSAKDGRLVSEKGC